MNDDWQEYYRKATPSHKLEAKRARGGEVLGDKLRVKIAEEGEWICRNPANGFTWTINDIDFNALYKSRDYKYETKKRKKKKLNTKLEKTSASNEAAQDTNLDAGPLFEDET